MKLAELLAKVSGVTQLSSYSPWENLEVQGLKTNSHACTPGDLFIGMPGYRVDGGDFWPSAIANGAVGAIISPQAIQKHPPSESDVVISYSDMNQACAQIATAFMITLVENSKWWG